MHPMTPVEWLNSLGRLAVGGKEFCYATHLMIHILLIAWRLDGYLLHLSGDTILRGILDTWLLVVINDRLMNMNINLRIPDLLEM
jgi:hypothetical protein